MTRNEFFDSLERDFGHLSPRENILASKAYSVVPEKAEREMARLKYQLSLTRGEKAKAEKDGDDVHGNPAEKSKAAVLCARNRV